MDPELFDFLIYEAKLRYHFNDVFYHDFNHACMVLDQVKFLTGNLVSNEIRDTYKMAALYHDVVYIPGAHNGINEDASAAMLAHDFMRGCIKLNIVVPFTSMHMAQKVIEQTTVEHHMSTKCVDYMAPILDADLYSLSLPYEEFVVNQKKIIAENLGDPETKQMHQKSANFLIALAKRGPSIYRTNLAIESWETKAQENIHQWYNEAYTK